ncbi:MAG: NapC/NirT family cytochrome c, partial [bacterium]
MTNDKSILEKGLWRNPMSYMGIIMTGFAAILIGVLLVIDFLAAVHSAYLGVLLFFILPVFFMAGFVLVAWGMWDERKRRHKISAVEVARFPILDLNIGAHRTRFMVFMAGVVFVALILTVIAYEAYHFTESLTFCGELCHVVMHPEAIASQNSPHARVTCAECHVGPGAGWYVRSKLAGSRQMLAVLTDSFPRPIPPAIQHLRPARETCEECHWPEKFYGSKLKVRTHFGFDEKNTPHDVSMLVRIGGGESAAREGGSGIHWHMLADKEVTFKAADPGLQIIPLVWEKHGDGTVTEYRLQGYEGEEPQNGHGGEERLVDCVVCHNRPTHIYRSPDDAMDKAMVEEAIDHKLPYIKKMGVQILLEDYQSHEDAAEKIRDGILTYYEENYPKVFTGMAAQI